MEFWALNDMLAFDGWVDEVALYNHALTDEQVQAHYVAGNTEVPIPGEKGIKSWKLTEQGLEIEYVGTLKASTAVDGTYDPVPDATSPHTAPLTGDQQFFRAD